MPAAVIDDPLGITCTFSNGTARVARLVPGANPELARQLLVALADLVHPHGRLDSARTIETYLVAVRALLALLECGGFRGSAEELTRGRLTEVWMGATHSTESLSRILLRRLDDLHGAPPGCP